MRLRQLVTLTVCVHTAFTGSRMLVSLYAIHLLHASDFTVGALLSSYALLPMLIAVTAGRLVDRSGARWPLFGASASVALGAPRRDRRRNGDHNDMAVRDALRPRVVGRHVG